MIDWYERKSSYVLVMERPERHIDLFDYLNQAGPIREPVVRDIFIQVTNTRSPQNLTLFLRSQNQLSTATTTEFCIEILKTRTFSSRAKSTTIQNRPLKLNSSISAAVLDSRSVFVQLLLSNQFSRTRVIQNSQERQSFTRQSGSGKEDMTARELLFGRWEFCHGLKCFQVASSRSKSFLSVVYRCIKTLKSSTQ